MNISNTEKDIYHNPLNWEKKSKPEPFKSNNLLKSDWNDEENQEWEEEQYDEDIVAGMFIYKST